jgi:hypothetical protein
MVTVYKQFIYTKKHNTIIELGAKTFSSKWVEQQWRLVRVLISITISIKQPVEALLYIRLYI